MINHLLKISLLLLLPISIFTQSTDQLKIILNNGAFKDGTSNMDLVIRLENNGQDTLRVIKPDFNQFDKNYSFQEIKYMGEIKKPYSLELEIEGTCETPEESMAPVQDEAKYLHLGNYNVVTLAPGKSKNYKVSLNLIPHVKFCDEASFVAQVNYNPQYEGLSQRQKKVLEKKKKKFEKIMEGAKAFIREENLSSMEVKTTGSMIHFILDSNQLMESLTKITVSSKPIELSKR